jgi:hypothetical protein
VPQNLSAGKVATSFPPAGMETAWVHSREISTYFSGAIKNDGTARTEPNKAFPYANSGSS